MRKMTDCKTLFLDRDGVINVRKMDGYITKPEEFVFMDGVLEAFSMFSRMFETIVVVTNQQGIGKGLMSEDDFEKITRKMTDEINARSGRVDGIFHCPYLARENHFTRKPSVGMGLQARKRFKNIRFKDSIMIGDSLSDVVFGKHLGMYTVHISPDAEQARMYPRLIDMRFDSLFEFAKYFQDEKKI